MGTRALFSTKIVPPIFTGGASFTPASISGLALWLDAADTATITQAANLVSQWNDKSGNNYHFTQGTGSNQPLTNTTTLNSLNALLFDGAGDNLVRTNTDLSSALQNDCTIFVVCKLNSLVRGTMFRKDGAEFNIQYNTGVTQLNTSHNTAFQFSNLSITGDLNTHIAAMRVNGTVINGIYDGTVAPNGMASATTTGQINIGTDRFAGLAFNGPMGEIIAYNRNLTNAEINQVGGYLSTKWGASWTNI